MRIAVAGLVACLLSAVAAVAQAALPPPTASVSATSHKPGAQTALTFVMSYEMQCGSPGAGPVLLTLPHGMTAPSSVDPSSVLVNGAAAASVKQHGSLLTIGIKQRTGVMCDVIGPGKLTVAIPRSSGLRNPTANGTYAFHVVIGPVDADPKLRISS
jgi:hypothetical protein